MKKRHSQGITWEHVREAAERAGLPFNGPEDWHPVEAFVFLAKQGVAPPPALLIAVGEAFGRYFDSAGQLEIEAELFGRSVQRAGNFAARRVKANDRAVDDLAEALVRERNRARRKVKT